VKNLVSSNIGIQPEVQFQRYHARKILKSRFCLAVLLEAELRKFRHNSRSVYENVVNFGEHDLHNIPHNFGIQPKVNFDYNNPNAFIET
jgi:hypothetical protein